MAAIEIQDVSKRYRDGTLAVRDLSLQIADGEFTVLVGPSGCGKTTLLRMIAGLEEISAGTISIGDRVVNDLTPKDRDIAMVFQNYALYPHMTVARNMGFALRRAKVPAEEIRRKVEHAADLLGISDQLERKPGNLSGGQRQRVAMGRAIVRDPQAFLMDEPLSNLDAKLRIQMRSEITRIQRRLHTTTVYVTHDQTEAMTLGDRLAVMRDGVIQQLGTPAELYERPQNLFVAGFIGAPAMNFLIGEISDGSLTSPLGTIALAQSNPAHPSTHSSGRPWAGHSGRVVIGLRPESFEDAAMVGERPGLVSLTAMVDVLESTGSDVYAHLSLNGAGSGWAGSDPDDPVLRELAEATASEDPEVALATGSELVARVGVSHSLTEGQEGRLWIDTGRIHLFDPATGRRLSG
ncbi:MAG TPA: sn-glycerol-3-phosphate ABC transporter ATP-binding protein UgpC [Solirubrobacteraceae bacterium]|jgi:multiple sugar transport system ATP-binding protein|nr:sn-glycerol-3-phosphate ABC transporter ATP-binding protein UgpC [Solirubrobacteraceae bacterium]